MVPESYLRVYQPLDTFEAAEREKWSAYIDGGAQLPLTSPYRHVAFDDHQMGFVHPYATDHAFVKKALERWFVCPWRTKLRVLVGLLTIRNSLPFEIADAFVPESVAVEAAAELEMIRDQQRELRAYIQTSTWHVPLRWFIAFDDADRLVTRDRDRDRVRVRYEAQVGHVMDRLRRAIGILQEAGMAESVVSPVEELLEWLFDFPADSILELDYGSITKLFSDEELTLDRSAGEVWACLEALDRGDFEESGRVYSDMATWWGRVRSLQSAN